LFLTVAALVVIPSAKTVSADGEKLAIGTAMTEFSLSDINGKMMSAKDVKGAKGTVVIFLSAQCPVVKGYIERIGAVAKDYSAKGINFVGINSNATEDMKWVKSDTEQNFKFTVLKDQGNVIADKWGASVTPEIYFFDADGKLAYRGAIDNDRKGENITKTYLRDALDNAIAGKAIAEKETNAFGCSIKKAEMGKH
jgi:peroxiredoxin